MRAYASVGAQVDYEIVGKHGTFEQQVTTMSRAGVVMMAHGAAATNRYPPDRRVSETPSPLGVCFTVRCFVCVVLCCVVAFCEAVW